ncbi:lipoprotein [Spirochaetia bacterium 38H-sp]|uniref:Lipoprotein n=1 Tax=Rarispira pelagica TaxID=3141764 RepID=A0ABU9UB01_9SPIR
MKKIVLLIIILFILTSCQSLPYRADREDVDIVISLINKGDITALTAVSRLPFLFESEIISTPTDMQSLWQYLSSGGFKLKDYTIREIFYPERISDLWPGIKMEIDSYQKNYLNQDTNCVIIDTAGGEFMLLIGRPVKGIPSILGIRGPAL